MSPERTEGVDAVEVMRILERGEYAKAHTLLERMDGAERGEASVRASMRRRSGALGFAAAASLLERILDDHIPSEQELRAVALPLDQDAYNALCRAASTPELVSSELLRQDAARTLIHSLIHYYKDAPNPKAYYALKALNLKTNHFSLSIFRNFLGRLLESNHPVDASIVMWCEPDDIATFAQIITHRDAVLTQAHLIRSSIEHYARRLGVRPLPERHAELLRRYERACATNYLLHQIEQVRA